MLATTIASTVTATIAIRAMSTELSMRFPMRIAPRLPLPNLSAILIETSCPAIEDTAHMMLSTVEMRPDRISRKNR